MRLALDAFQITDANVSLDGGSFVNAAALDGLFKLNLIHREAVPQTIIHHHGPL